MINNTLKENPSYVLRNKIPGKELNQRGHRVFYQLEAFENSFDYDNYDIFVFNRFYEGEMYDLISYLKKMGKIIVYETDDNYFGINSKLPTHKMRKHAIKSSFELAQHAHVITVSTPNLKEIFEKKFPGKPIFQIPNALDLDDYEQREARKKLRIGWQGSDVHISDLLMVMPTIKKLQDEFDFKFILFGIDGIPIKEFYEFAKKRNRGDKWEKDIIELYEVLETMDYIHYPFEKDYASYRKKLASLDLDIGICPLEDTAFNNAKSCLKFYEYAATGTTALASNVEPYNTEMYKKDMADNTPEDWGDKLRKLIEDKDYRFRRHVAQRSWLKGCRDIKKVARDWESVYNLLIESRNNENITNKK